MLHEPLIAERSFTASLAECLAAANIALPLCPPCPTWVCRPL